MFAVFHRRSLQHTTQSVMMAMAMAIEFGFFRRFRRAEEARYDEEIRNLIQPSFTIHPAQMNLRIKGLFEILKGMERRFDPIRGTSIWEKGVIRLSPIRGYPTAEIFRPQYRPPIIQAVRDLIFPFYCLLFGSSQNDRLIHILALPPVNRSAWGP